MTTIPRRNGSNKELLEERERRISLRTIEYCAGKDPGELGFLIIMRLGWGLCFAIVVPGFS